MIPFPDDPIDFLFSLERLGMKFGLENISRVCAALEHPERAFRSVLVAGTNGKGSVTATVERALRGAGHRTARYTSPHLVRLEERFVIHGKEVTTAALRGAAGRVRDVVARLLADGELDGPPTFFECTTAAAFDLFREGGVDIAVVEVGLGGRLDATNILTPIATVITSIDFDHQEQLGTSIESIAGEKAGIVKPGVPLICGSLSPAAERVIRHVCEAQGAPFIRADDRVSITVGQDGAVDVRARNRLLPAVRLALEGHHQRQNAVVALALLDELSRSGIDVPDAAMREGLSSVEWPGRLEHFEVDGVHILLDAAHNPAGAAALAAYVAEQGWRDATLILGVVRDKDVRGILESLLRPAHVWGLLVCTSPPSPRALGADELAAAATALVTPGVRIQSVGDPAAALRRARGRRRPVAAAGSIFLIGPLRDILR